MKNLYLLRLSFLCFRVKKTLFLLIKKTSDVINTFYSDALELRESYELLRVLSKDIGARPSGSEGAKKAVLWSKEVMERVMVLILFTYKRLWCLTGKEVN